MGQPKALSHQEPGQGGWAPAPQRLTFSRTNCSGNKTNHSNGLLLPSKVSVVIDLVTNFHVRNVIIS